MTEVTGSHPRRRALIVGASVAGLAAAAWLLLASGGTAQSAAPAGVDPAPAVPNTFVEGDDAVARASRFLVSLLPEEAVGYAIVLDLVDRKFDVDWIEPLIHYTRWTSARPGGEQAGLFARVYDPGAHLPQPPASLAANTTDRLTTTALHCDTFALPADYVAQLDKGLASRSLSDRTHATIAILWADEHGCLDLADADRLRRKAADVLEQSIRQEPDVHDQWVEAVALLYQLGERGRVEDSWITAIRDAQRPDGGWVEEVGAENSSGHTTTLALWVLLEAENPDAKPTTWIRDP